MTPEDIRALIPQYLTDDLSNQERAAFEECLQSDSSLRDEVEELRELWQQLRFLPVPEPSAALRARFYQKLNAITSPRPVEPQLWWRRKFLWQAAAACLVFAAGLGVGRIQFPAAQMKTNEISQLQTQVEGLRQTVALSLLDKPSATSRLQGVEWGSQITQPDQELMTALLATLNNDQNINVRLAALDALEKFTSDASVRRAMEQSIARQQSPLVQIALIDALVHINDQSAAKEFQQLTTNSSVNDMVRERARWAVKKLSLN